MEIIALLYCYLLNIINESWTVRMFVHLGTLINLYCMLLCVYYLSFFLVASHLAVSIQYFWYFKYMVEVIFLVNISHLCQEALICWKELQIFQIANNFSFWEWQASGKVPLIYASSLFKNWILPILHFKKSLPTTQFINTIH